MANEPHTDAELAHEIVRSRDGIAAVARRCSLEQWPMRPLEGDGRPVGVVIDHVADSYLYMGRWIRLLVAGEPIEVSAEIIDALNARHAEGAANVSKEQVIDHLQECGDEFASLVRSLSDADLDRGDGRVRRFALIAIRHADDHGAEIEVSLGINHPT
jgi:DinB superfamily